MNKIVKTKNAVYILTPTYRIRLPPNAKISKPLGIYKVEIDKFILTFTEYSTINVFDKNSKELPLLPPLP